MERIYTSTFILGIFFCYSLTSCKKFLEIGIPKTTLVKESVFNSDETAVATILEVYSRLVNEDFASGNSSSFTYLGALSGDELDFFKISTPDFKEFYDNALLSTNNILSNSLWNSPYRIIYRTNAILEGLKSSYVLSEVVKSRIEGEARFIRAFCYFYLVNFFGDVPLVMTTDYKLNTMIPRTSQDQVYQQIIDDLKMSKSLLSEKYVGRDNTTVTTERARVNRFSASALLARVYLFRKNWKGAEEEASEVINNTGLYELVPISNVFIKNSKEAIWQLSNDFGNAKDASTFFLPVGITVPNDVSLTLEFVNSFEENDLRKESWVGVRTTNVSAYYFTNKYKALSIAPIVEYSMVLRLGEQYLIRAEARINQAGKLIDGIGDLNAIRTRAAGGIMSPNRLQLLPLTISKTEALDAVEEERQHELFTEWGHRWLDLKRWPSKNLPSDNSLSRADDILKLIKPSWRREAKLYPIPQIQLLSDPAMANQQNPGYD